MIQLPFRLLTSSLSNARGEMWLKLEFPLAGEAEEQENEREGKQRRLTALSLHKQKVC